MRKFAALFVTMLFALGATLAFGAGPIDDLAGRKNVVLLFSKSRSEAELDRQMGLFSDRRAELDDRDIVVLLTVKGRDAMAVFGYARVSDGTGRQLTTTYEPKGSGLTVVLVGKDGGERGRWTGIVDPQKIFDLIDQAIEPEAQTGSSPGG